MADYFLEVRLTRVGDKGEPSVRQAIGIGPESGLLDDAPALKDWFPNWIEHTRERLEHEAKSG